MKQLTRIEPEVLQDEEMHKEWLVDGNKWLNVISLSYIVNVLAQKVNDLTDEVNRMKNEGAS